MGEWRADPEGRYQYRWWDEGWTDRVAHDGKVGVVPLTAPVEEAGTVTHPDPPAARPAVVDAEAALSPLAGLSGPLVGQGPTDLGNGPVVVVGQALSVDLAQPVLARRGAMVAVQGEAELSPEAVRSGGFSIRGDLAMMWARGEGRMVLAADGREVHLVHLTAASFTVVATHLLALGGDLERTVAPLPGGSISAGEVVAMTVSGTGWVALSSHGAPLTMDTAAAPTLVDAAAVLGWSAGLEATLVDAFAASDYVGRGSGEPQQIRLEGAGLVVVQPSEQAPAEAPR